MFLITQSEMDIVKLIFICGKETVFPNAGLDNRWHEARTASEDGYGLLSL